MSLFGRFRKEVDPLSRFRKQIDQFMKGYPQSPLSREQRRNFQGLNYYDEDEAYVFEIPVKLLPESEPPVPMQTSTGDVREYRRWGQVSFEVEGQEATLTIYRDPQGGDLFLPFKDTTSGRESYGAGRYLDSQRPGLELNGARLRLDFNYAYNPYCAYSPDYSCPLPPVENWLKVPIRAGEKKFE